MGDVRHGQLVTAAFSEFRGDGGKVIVDIEAYEAPTLAAARAMLRAAPQVVNRSANGVEAGHRVGREQVGVEGILLTGPGLNGEGATALLWRDGRLLGMVAVDGGAPSARGRLVRTLVNRQETLVRRTGQRQG
jgi:hypothetical protein